VAAKKRRGVPKPGAFLAAFRLTASVTKAAKAAKLDRSLHYRWLKEDPAYAPAFAEAAAEAAQLLEDEAVRRAYEGVEEPLVYKGEFTYPWRQKVNKETGEVTNVRGNKPLTINTKSDGLLMFLLKGFKPEKYRDSWKGELTGAGGGPIAITDAGLTNLNDDELGNLIAIAKKLSSAGGDGS